VSTGRDSTPRTCPGQSRRPGQAVPPERTKLLGLITPGTHAEQATGWDGTIAKSDHAAMVGPLHEAPAQPGLLGGLRVADGAQGGRAG
jgi:hypothetical protein